MAWVFSALSIAFWNALAFTRSGPSRAQNVHAWLARFRCPGELGVQNQRLSGPELSEEIYR